MPDQNFNPIKMVKPAGALSPEWEEVPCPSEYKYELEDVSQSDAGRTEDCVMHKCRIGQVVALELVWNNIDNATVSRVLQLFQPEYLDVQYYDALAGTYKQLEFYVGNRSAPMYNHRLGLWQNLSFKIIDRNGAIKTT